MKSNARYAAVILACLMLVGVVFSGLNTTVSGLYVIPITEELGFSRALYSTAVSLSNLSYAVMCLFFGLLLNKLGMKRMVGIGGLVHAAAMVLLSLSESIGAVIALSIVRGVATAFCGTLIIPVLVQKWFTKGYGTCISAIYVVTTLGGLVFCSLVANWIAQCGWDGSYRITALIMAASTLLLLVFLRESPPASLPGNGTGALAPPEQTGLTLKEAARTLPFYLFLLMSVLIGSVIYVMMLLLPSVMGGKGFSLADQALFNNVMLFACLIVKLPLGVLADKKGVVLEILICFLCASGGFLLLLLSDGRAAMYGGSALLGVGTVTLTATTPVLVNQYFGRKDYGSIYGIFMATATAGFAAVNPLFNGIYDATGSYDGAFVLSLVLLAVMIALLLLGAKTAARDKTAG